MRAAESGGKGLFLSGDGFATRPAMKKLFWPGVIWVTAPWSSLQIAFDQAGFRDGDTAIVTITGVLETYNSVEDLVFANNHILGFRPDNIAPAQTFTRYDRQNKPERVSCSPATLLTP